MEERVERCTHVFINFTCCSTYFRIVNFSSISFHLKLPFLNFVRIYRPRNSKSWIKFPSFWKTPWNLFQVYFHRWKHHFVLYLFIAGISFSFFVLLRHCPFLTITTHSISLIPPIQRFNLAHWRCSLLSSQFKSLRSAILINFHVCVSTFVRRDLTRISFFIIVQVSRRS